MEENKIRIYFAASLFNGRETSFNLDLTNILKSMWQYDVMLPQRDGFEFSNLYPILENAFEHEKEAKDALDVIIRVLDLGWFLPRQDLLVANLDEPPDSGVDMEIAFASLMEKFVIGFRTDTRSPYNPNNYGGVHPFAGGLCDEFILQPGIIARNSEEFQMGMFKLAIRIKKSIEANKDRIKRKVPSYALQTPKITRIVKAGNILFSGIKNINSDIDSIIKRYKENKDLMEKLIPISR